MDLWLTQSKTRPSPHTSNEKVDKIAGEIENPARDVLDVAEFEIDPVAMTTPFGHLGNDQQEIGPAIGELAERVVARRLRVK